MEVQLDSTIRNSYETLPDLLNDLSTLASSGSKKIWSAAIDCGGDLHNLSFNSGYFSAPSSSLKKENTEEIKQTYESMEALMAELEHIKQYMSAHEDDLGRVNLSYQVLGNGGKPFLRMRCHASDPEDDCDPFDKACYLSPKNCYQYYLMQSIYIIGGSLLAATPVLLLAKYLNLK